MGKAKQAYENRKGELFPTPDASTVSDLASVLGEPRLGILVLNKRAEIEAIFREHDEMITPETGYMLMDRLSTSVVRDLT